MRKSILSLFVIVCVVFSCCPAQITAIAADTDHLLFAINFDNQECTAEKGKAILNGSIGYELSNDGTYAASFDGAAENYISIYDEKGESCLKDKEQITVCFDRKAANAISWWLFAAPDDSTQAYAKEHYLGILDTGNQIKAEFYNNNGSRPQSSTGGLKGDVWQNIVITINDTALTLYIDGKAASTKTYNYILSDILGDNPITYVGKANWGNGEWATGAIDNIRIYDFAPKFDLGDLSNITTDIELPVCNKDAVGYDVTWESSDESVISLDGKVTRPAVGDKNVLLTATISFDDYVLTQTFEATVKAKDALVKVNQEGAIIKSIELSIPENTKEAKVIIAEYNDTWVDVKTIDAVKSGTVDVNYTISGELAKIMVWNENMEPLSAVRMLSKTPSGDMEGVRIVSYLDDRGKTVSLAPRAGAHTENTPVIVWEYDVYEHHTYAAKAVDVNTYIFISRTGGSGMAIASNGDYVGDEILLKPYDEDDEYQMWIAEYTKDGFCRLKNKASGMYLSCMRTTNYSMYKDGVIQAHTVRGDRWTNLTMANCVQLPRGANCDEAQLWKLDFPEK